METLLRAWSEVREILATRWPMAQSTSEPLNVLTFAYPSPGKSPEILQAVSAELGGRTRVLIGVNVMPATKASAQDALAINSERLIGCLMTLKGTLVLRQVLTLGRFDEAELIETV